jgi:hypothetical protein
MLITSGLLLSRISDDSMALSKFRIAVWAAIVRGDFGPRISGAETSWSLEGVREPVVESLGIRRERAEEWEFHCDKINLVQTHQCLVCTKQRNGWHYLWKYGNKKILNRSEPIAEKKPQNGKNRIPF